MKDQQIFKQYIDLLPFLAAVLGNECEIVIHDLTNPQASIIAIKNPVSGRKKGDALTHFAQEILDQGLYHNQDFIANYNGQSKHHDFLSSTFFIKNGKTIIGMLCINKNLTPAKHTMFALENLLKSYNLIQNQEENITEQFDSSIIDIAKSRIQEIIARQKVPVAYMSIEDKLTVLQKLKDDAILDTKGSIQEVAAQLHVSIPTIYRYLKRIK